MLLFGRGFFFFFDGLRVRNSRHSTSSETLCVRKICSQTEVFMIRGVREPRFDCISIAFAIIIRVLSKFIFHQQMHK